jgi:hypothetical protein
VYFVRHKNISHKKEFATEERRLLSAASFALDFRSRRAKMGNAILRP